MTMNTRLAALFDRIGQGMAILRTEGVTAFAGRVGNQLRRLRGQLYQGHYDQGYNTWLVRHRWGDDDSREARDRIAAMSRQPQFSVLVPVYRVAPQWIRQTVQSVLDQVYPHWQLCLVDDHSDDDALRQTLESLAAMDPRIHCRFNSKNLGIAAASSIALDMAEGSHIVLLDHDDLLGVDALYRLAEAVNTHPRGRVFYSDEDKVDVNGNRSIPFFKPDYSPELLEAQNYFGHILCIERELVEKVGGFHDGVDGAQDYDLVLRATEQAGDAVHIPRVLYHWRQIPGSTAARFDAKDYAREAGRRALEQHCERRGIDATVEQGAVPGTYRLKRHIRQFPITSIVIPFRDRADMLERCLRSALACTDWPNLEIIGIDNGSAETETANLVARWQDRDDRVRFIRHDADFNFSVLCNLGVKQAKGDFVVLMNNDIEITSPGWLEALMEHAMRAEIGAVGGKLVYPDGRIQHAGIVVGIGGSAGHPHKTFAADHIGYFGRLQVTANVSAVTAALLAVKKEKYLAAGGFNEKELAVAYNDVDFCLKLVEQGWRNVFTPYCEAIHHESASRGLELSEEQKSRHENEKNHLQQRWPEYFAQGDPCYNPNLSLQREDYTLNMKRGRRD